MSSFSDSIDIEQVNKVLQKQLPDASVVLTELPHCVPLKLWLLQKDFDDRALDQDTIERISDDPPYWIFCWASGYALAQHIMLGEIDVANKVVVDFGAGSGVVAIAACLMGAKSVVTCEIDPVANWLIDLNAKANGVSLQQVQSLSEVGEAIDLLVAADVLYEKENLRFLDLFLQYADSVFIADSRQKNISHSQYRLAGRRLAKSFPDYGESLEFNDVRFFQAGR